MGKAIVMETTGGPEVLKLADHDPGPPGPGQARIAVEASGINFIDTYHRTGLYPVKLPFIPGAEAAGIVEAVGAGVKSVQPGARVALVGAGCYASHVVAPAAVWCWPRPSASSRWRSDRCAISTQV